MDGGMMWLGLLMMVVGLLVFAGIILLAVWAVTRLTGREHGPSSGTATTPEDPLVILQRRYARGEIGRDDYERIRSDLQSQH
jgi:putative membrane protein